MKIFNTVLPVVLFSAALSAQTIDPRKTGNVPIAFYGKVIDQSNQPVAGVDVRLEIHFGYLTSPTSGEVRSKPVSLTTDTNGIFVLTGENGSYVQFLTIEKEGYKLLPKQEKMGFMYYPKPPNLGVNNPVVFKMWKQRGAEPLIASGWHGNVTCDGVPLIFDLRNGKLAKDGNLRITCTRVPLQIVPREHKRYDYSFQIAMLGGGIQTTEDEFTYLAPEGGYAPSITLGAKADNTKWVGNVKQEFYIKTVDGHYGRLSVDWYADLSSPTHFEWDSSINPSGSRNLER
jgi:hypothetical protein